MAERVYVLRPGLVKTARGEAWHRAESEPALASLLKDCADAIEYLQQKDGRDG